MRGSTGTSMNGTMIYSRPRGYDDKINWDRSAHCRVCGGAIRRGKHMWYDRQTKTVLHWTCLGRALRGDVKTYIVYFSLNDVNKTATATAISPEMAIEKVKRQHRGDRLGKMFEAVVWPGKRG